MSVRYPTEAIERSDPESRATALVNETFPIEWEVQLLFFESMTYEVIEQYIQL